MQAWRGRATETPHERDIVSKFVPRLEAVVQVHCMTRMHAAAAPRCSQPPPRTAEWTAWSGLSPRKLCLLHQRQLPGSVNE